MSTTDKLHERISVPYRASLERSRTPVERPWVDNPRPRHAGHEQRYRQPGGLPGHRRRAGAVPGRPDRAGFWALVSGGGTAFVAAVHFGPTAIEPPELILDHSQPPVLGWLAFGWLTAFVTVLANTCVYETRLWAQQRQTRRAHPADAEGIR